MSRGLGVVDPYGPYGWIRSFSIRTRSDNCISLRGLRIFSTLYRCEGGYGLSIRTVRTDGIGCFQSVHDRKIASYQGELEYFLGFTGVKGVSGSRSVRSVRME